MKKYGVVLVGCGGMAKTHLSGGVGSHSQAKLIGVVDLIPKKAQEYAEEFKAESWGTDYRSYLKRKDVEIIIITTWPSSHKKIAIDALNSGKDVLCEKPLAPTMKEAKEIAEAVKKTGRKLRVGYVLRFNKSYQKIAKMIKEGKIGHPILMRMICDYHSTTQEIWQRWSHLIKDTSAVIDCGCHYVDVMRWFTRAEAASVKGEGIRLNKETSLNTYDYGMLTVKFTDGSLGLYESGWGYHFRNHCKREFIGPKGRIRLIHAGHRFEYREEGDLVEYYTLPDRYEIINVPGAQKPVDVEFQDLIDYIEKDKDPLPVLDDALKSLEIMFAGHKSSRTGKTIFLLPHKNEKR